MNRSIIMTMICSLDYTHVETLNESESQISFGVSRWITSGQIENYFVGASGIFNLSLLRFRLRRASPGRIPSSSCSSLRGTFAESARARFAFSPSSSPFPQMIASGLTIYVNFAVSFERQRIERTSCGWENHRLRASAAVSNRCRSFLRTVDCAVYSHSSYKAERDPARLDRHSNWKPLTLAGSFLHRLMFRRHQHVSTCSTTPMSRQLPIDDDSLLARLEC